jgi:hypothetical protein
MMIRHFLFFLGMTALLTLIPGCISRKMVVGVYFSDRGDTLRLRDNISFRIEVLEPDTVVQKQLKFTSGRWYKKKRKLYLTVAAKEMGEYWGCVPMHITFNHLRRPVDCEVEGKGITMNFHKVRVKKPKDPEKEKKKRKKGKDDQVEKDTGI